MWYNSGVSRCPSDGFSITHYSGLGGLEAALLPFLIGKQRGPKISGGTTVSDIRLADIADKLGVSISTVSRAIQSKGSARMSTQYREIQRIAKEMGYNRASLAAKKNNVGKIALVNVDICTGVEQKRLGYSIEGFFGPLVYGLQQALRKHSCELSVFSIERGPDTVQYIQTILQQSTIDGIILNVNGGFDEVSDISMLQPIVQVNASIGTTGVDSVVSDNFGGMMMVVRRLIELGHRKIAFWIDKPSTLHHIQRLYGYRAAMASAGIDYDRVYLDDRTVMQPYEERMMAGFQDYLNDPDKPTAIIGACDGFGLSLLQLANYYNISMPDELSLFSFDNLEISSHTYPSLSTVDAHLDLMAAEAVELLLRRRANPDVPFRRVVLQASLVERSSSGPVSSLVNG